MKNMEYKKRIKAAGRYNISVFVGSKPNKHGFQQPYFSISNSRKDKESGEWTESQWYYLEDLYALQATLGRAIIEAEQICAQPTEQATPAANGNSTIDEDEIPF